MLNSELIIIGHGRTNNKESTQLITKHARSIKERGIFSRVRSGFLNIGPYADNQLATATSESIFIVPCFASAGSLTQRVIPQKLGIKGPVTIKGKTKIYYCKPVGNHKSIPARLHELITITMDNNSIEKSDTTVIVVGHGSKNNKTSQLDTESIAKKLNSFKLAKNTICLFLDQQPNLNEWASLSNTGNVIVVSFLFSGGGHETIDIPKMMSFNQSQLSGRFTINKPIGPIKSMGKTIWLAPPISSDPIIQDIIVERAEEALQS